MKLAGVARVLPWLLAAVLAPWPARAWSNQGHMASGEAAYDVLAARDPGVVRAVVATVAALPRRQLMDAALRGLSGPARDRVTFAWLARWPDDVRETPLDRPTHHYRLRAVSDIGAILPLRNGGAEDAYAAGVAMLRNPRASSRDRAIALGWLFHIVGDMHQPLHAGTWLSWSFPKTDRAGTIAYIRPAPGAAPETLHEFWDDAADRPGSETAGADAIAAEIERRFPRERLPELMTRPDRFVTWADESAGLARRAAYLDGHLHPATRPQAATPVPAGYAARARDIAERRLAVASNRLADVLRETVPAR